MAPIETQAYQTITRLKKSFPKNEFTHVDLLAVILSIDDAPKTEYDYERLLEFLEKKQKWIVRTKWIAEETFELSQNAFDEFTTRAPIN